MNDLPGGSFQKDKRVSMDEAAALVWSGSTLALGGMTLYRRPVAFSLALIRRFRENRFPDNLTLLCFTAGFESDLLVGSGLIQRVRSCYFGLEIFGLAPMFTYCANRGAVEVIEETEASLAYGLRAKMAGVGFMPGKAWLGTDLLQLRPDVRTIVDPYLGEELVAFPALHPDIAVIHALQADPEGNAVIGRNRGIDEELALTAGTVIVTAEEIVPELNRADIVAPLVKAVVHSPGGARPTSCHPYYPFDGEAVLSYTEKVSDPASLEVYLDGILGGS
jgi:glutaconate CoA-transferase, subunit A